MNKQEEWNPEPRELKDSMQKPAASEWLSGEQVCRMLRISKRTLQNYRDNRIIPFSQIKRKIYYKYTDIIVYLEMHYVKAPNMEGGVS